MLTEPTPTPGEANIIRALMILVCLVSYPLCAVPATQIIESRLPRSEDRNNSIGLKRRILIRTPFVLCTTAVGGLVPGFVDIVSLIGCFSVGLVSYCLPPLFFLMLVRKGSIENAERSVVACQFAFVLGCIATFFSTYLTVKSIWF